MKKLMAVCLVAWSCASPVGAQSFFVDGTVFASIERRARAETMGESVAAGGIDGTVAGGGATVGAWLTPQVSVRLEMSFPATLESSEERTNGIGLPIPVSVPISFPRGAPLYVVRTEASERTRTFAALIAYHSARWHRVQLGYVGGAAFLTSTRHEKVSATFPTIVMPPGLSVIPYPSAESSLTTYRVAVEAGLDADVSLASRFSIVPALRVVGFDGGLSVRPGVALRARW